MVKKEQVLAASFAAATDAFIICGLTEPMALQLSDLMRQTAEQLAESYVECCLYYNYGFGSVFAHYLKTQRLNC